MKRLVLILGFLCFAGSLAFSQGSKVQKANAYFESFSFVDAIKSYESVVEKSLEVKRKLATCYLKTGNLDQAEKNYQEILNSNSYDAQDMYNYAAVLRMNKKYELADSWMKKFHEAKPSDVRSTLNALNVGGYKNLLHDNGQYTIKNLEENSSYEDFSPSYFRNQVVFVSSRVSSTTMRKSWNWNQLPYLNVFVADCTENHDLANIKRFRPVKNQKYHEGPVTFNKAGDLMVVTRNNNRVKSPNNEVRLHLYYSQFHDGKWGEDIPMPFNSAKYSVGQASLSEDGKTLYFASDMRGGHGGVDLYRSSRNADGSWSQPINLGNDINTEGDEMFPFIHPSGKLYFASNGHPGLGGLDVFVTKIGGNGLVDEIVNLGAPINSNLDDFSFILDKNQTHGYFASNRDGGKGKDDIYSFTNDKATNSGKLIQGFAKDNSGNVLPNTDVVLLKSDGKGVAFVTTDSNGKFEFHANDNMDYFILASHDDFEDKMIYLDTYSTDLVVNQDVVLSVPPVFSLEGLVVDSQTKEPLKGAQVVVVNLNTNTKEVFTTSANGLFTQRWDKASMNDDISLQIAVKKSSYQDKSINYSQKLTRKRVYQTVIELEAP